MYYSAPKSIYFLLSKIYYSQNNQTENIIKEHNEILKNKNIEQIFLISTKFDNFDLKKEEKMENCCLNITRKMLNNTFLGKKKMKKISACSFL